MRFSSILVACGAVCVAALPSLPSLVAKDAACYSSGECRCNVANLQQPKTSLPPPASGLKLAIVAIGRGTQNYTCPTVANATAVPTAIGANATLYDFSCVASKVTVDQLGSITSGFEKLPRDNIILKSLPAVGKHFFVDLTTPTFALTNGLGTTKQKKVNATAAAASSPNAVPYLKLQAVPGQSSPVQEVYRLQTDNGSAPATCGKITGFFTVEYAATYWFYVPSNYSW